MPDIKYITAGWARQMADDCAAAQSSMAASAISMHVPRNASSDDWPTLWRTLAGAARLGRTVEIWLPSPRTQWPASGHNMQTAQELHKAGIKCYLLNGSRLLHAKCMVIDERIVWIGSGNFTAAAAHCNIEHYVRIESPAIAAQVLTHLRNSAGA